MFLGCFNLLHHVDSDATHPDDIDWTKDNLLVSNWFYSTISEILLEMCLQLYTISEIFVGYVFATLQSYHSPKLGSSRQPVHGQ
jgi:hypothetical protein